MVKNLQLKSEQVRLRLLNVIYKAKAGHIGGGLSSANILTALYFHVLNVDSRDPKKKDRDRFIMSKGHSVEILYSVLEAAGFISKETLDSYGDYASVLAGHPTIKIPGVEVSSGALGHGLSVGVGMAISAKMNQEAYKTFVLMGDGEQAEGSIYEAAMSGSHYKLDNLVGIIDRNGLQISDKTEEVMTLEPMRERWEAFGWEVLEMNGNDMENIIKTFESINYQNKKPHLIISKSTKGQGISYMENVLKWHHGVPSQEEFIQASDEIEQRIAQLEK
ncbi:transketolase [Apibacter sp. HY039]|uniref:transketolase n=1 Tax=Apibacter sp. HY039 TaxID=2501476 RepID=UPI001C87BB25|nr:transketolase [Apibacter sp. HY039]